MKRFLVVFALFFVLVPVFSACSQTTKLDVFVYFPQLSFSTFEGDSGEIQTKDFLDGKMTFSNYSSFRFEGSSEWIYGLEIEKIILVVVTNKDANIDLLFNLINVEQGTDEFGGSQWFRKTDIFFCKANKETVIEMTVDARFHEKTGSILIEVNNNSIFSNEFEWKLVGFDIVAHHVV